MTLPSADNVIFAVFVTSTLFLIWRFVYRKWDGR
jgi:hypothetical protein